MIDSIDFHKAQFETSAAGIAQCPGDSRMEVAFMGRSNAGKSSALNCLTANRNLARTSKTPGRTQLINFFIISAGTYLVDLPGYGYARVPRSVKENWHRLIDGYLRNRDPLTGLILVMDIRHPLKEFDTLMIDWAVSADMPLHVLLTKADKLKKGPARSTLLKLQAHLKQQGSQLSAQLFSSTRAQGRDQLMGLITSWFERLK